MGIEGQLLREKLKGGDVVGANNFHSILLICFLISILYSILLKNCEGTGGQNACMLDSPIPKRYF